MANVYPNWSFQEVTFQTDLTPFTMLLIKVDTIFNTTDSVRLQWSKCTNTPGQYPTNVSVIADRVTSGIERYALSVGNTATFTDTYIEIARPTTTGLRLVDTIGPFSKNWNNNSNYYAYSLGLCVDNNDIPLLCRIDYNITPIYVIYSLASEDQWFGELTMTADNGFRESGVGSYSQDAEDAARQLFGLVPPELLDPYGPGGYSGPGGGGGTYSFPGGSVDFPGLPTLSAADSGFCTLYNPSTAEIQALATYFWQTLDLTQLKGLFSNPMDAVLGLNIVPVTPTTGAAQTINIGNIASTVSAKVITNQYKEVDCGSVTVDEHWGAYLDYDGFTRCEIYLPYVGIHELNMSEIMGKTVVVKYHVDVLSGSCVAYVKCGDNVLYSFPGTCSVEVPVTASKFGSMLSAAASMATTALGRVAEAVGGLLNTPKDVMTSVFNAGRTKVEKSGSIGGSAGIMSIQYPYLIFTYPNQCVPENQNSFTGYPSYITAQLSGMIGYTEVDNIHLTGIPATSGELEEIENLLKEGVIF